MEKMNFESQVEPTINIPPLPKVVPVVTKSTSSKLPLIIVMLGIVIGVSGGYLFAKNQQTTTTASGSGNSVISTMTDKESIKIGTIYGPKDETTFRDKAEGVLVVGGINGEGTHHLIRPGGVSQTVYLSSSAVDLDLVVGDRVIVWGQTINSKKVGWLLDVGRLQVQELNAEPVE